MGEQTKNMLIGVFIIAACTLIVWLIMFLKPSVGNGEQIVYVRFSDINKINVGTRVMYAGKPVGEVVAINPIVDSRQYPHTDILGRLYSYQLTLKIDSHVKIYTTDQIALQTSGLLGEKSIAIVPKAPPKGVTPQLIVPKEPIYAESVDPIENVFVELSDLANDMEDTFREFTKWMRANGDSLGQTIQSIGDAMQEAKVAIGHINQAKIIDSVKQGVDNFSAAMGQMHAAIQEMHDGGTFANIGMVMTNLKGASRSIDLISKDIADGKGTLGKLIKGDDLYLRVTAIMSKVDTLMNDINHYGILFHLNKNWQRMRSQRVNLLNALNTPSSFQSYFETEVDQINTSMSRLSMLIDKAEESPEKQEILGNDRFKKDFAELLRQSEELSDHLRLYNQQLMDADNK
jgi:phospholipid/cholesterol/gamma-HCH transport system substrate-binding protein